MELHRSAVSTVGCSYTLSKAESTLCQAQGCETDVVPRAGSWRADRRQFPNIPHHPRRECPSYGFPFLLEGALTCAGMEQGRNELTCLASHQHTVNDTPTAALFTLCNSMSDHLFKLFFLFGVKRNQGAI